jgi:sortase A
LSAASNLPPKGSRLTATVGASNARRFSRILAILATALITGGAVILVDVGVTLAWMEPLSAIRGWFAQRGAEAQLGEVRRRFVERYPQALEADPRKIRRLANRFARGVDPGQAIGRLKIPGIGLEMVMLEGTDGDSLERGPGHYPQAGLPGQRGTVAIAGHRTTFLAPFRDIDEIGPGDRIVIGMPYGRFSYVFEKQRIVNPANVGVVRDVGHPRIVLTACHPLYSAAQRIVVFARLAHVRPLATKRLARQVRPS